MDGPIKLFNGMEKHLITSALRTQRDNEIDELTKLIKENPDKRPIFTKEFIKQQHDQLIDKVERNTEIDE